jgi:protein phosphatase
VEKLRHVLTQALTDHDRPLDPDVHAFGLEHRDRVLLCTDGLTDMVGDDVLTTHLKSDAPSADIARRLIEEALRAGGNDNVTAVIASYRMP